MKEHARIGIFDSGLGGFSVLREIKKETTADILYYGDQANAPYGNRTASDIVSLIKAILIHLKAEGVTHYVSACNSMSVCTTGNVLREIGIADGQYIDMVSAIHTYLHMPEDSSVLIVGTKATIESGVYQEILLNKVTTVDVFTPLDLARAIEVGDTDTIRYHVEAILCYAKKIQATHILYACTHYPLAHKEFVQHSTVIAWKGTFIDPAVYVAEAVRQWGLRGASSLVFESSKITPLFTSYIQRTTKGA